MAKRPPLGWGRIEHHTLQLAKTAHNEEKGSKEAIREGEWNKMIKTKKTISVLCAGFSVNGCSRRRPAVETGGQILSSALLPTLLEY